MSEKTEKLSNITKSLIETLGEDPNREGLIKTPLRVAKAWTYFSQGYSSNLAVINQLSYTVGVSSNCSFIIQIKVV